MTGVDKDSGQFKHYFLLFPPFVWRMTVHTLHEYVCWIIDNVQGLLMTIYFV
jgi:hypothetical protein